MTQNPFGLNFVNPDPTRIVVLGRIADGTSACVHGRTKCFRCDQWCWLGSETFEIVNSGGATPICMPCAKLIRQERGHFGTLLRSLKDH